MLSLSVVEREVITIRAFPLNIYGIHYLPLLQFFSRTCFERILQLQLISGMPSNMSKNVSIKYIISNR